MVLSNIKSILKFFPLCPPDDWVQFMKSSGSLPADLLLTVGENAEPSVRERVQYLPTYNEVEAMETYYNIKVPIDETGPLAQGGSAGYGDPSSLRKMGTQFLPLLGSKQERKLRWIQHLFNTLP